MNKVTRASLETIQVPDAVWKLAVRRTNTEHALRLYMAHPQDFLETIIVSAYLQGASDITNKPKRVEGTYEQER